MERLDGTFKAVKEKPLAQNLGGGDGGGSMLRAPNAATTAMSAIDKMERSIRRDRHDLDFQLHKINTTDD
ncbi:MAG: hypothetical protein IPM82_28375 [Saprospiraceae bacterium]|nr:hypothetical protein [Saprospiraceae bacterium]